MTIRVGNFIEVTNYWNGVKSKEACSKHFINIDHIQWIREIKTYPEEPGGGCEIRTTGTTIWIWETYDEVSLAIQNYINSKQK